MIEHSDGDVRCLFLGRDENLPPVPNVVFLKQVHGDAVVWATGEGHGSFGEGDALLTREKNTALQIRTADCVPILFYDTRGAIGAVHAGWRGLQKKILTKALAGIEIASLKFIVGPFIGQVSYEVGAEVALEFATEHSASKSNGKFWLNLKSILNAEMTALHIGADQVTWFDADTLTQNEWYSARRGDTGRNLALIWRNLEEI